jgi:hypothetical protein
MMEMLMVLLRFFYDQYLLARRILPHMPMVLVGCLLWCLAVFAVPNWDLSGSLQFFGLLAPMVCFYYLAAQAMLTNWQVKGLDFRQIRQKMFTVYAGFLAVSIAIYCVWFLYPVFASGLHCETEIVRCTTTDSMPIHGHWDTYTLTAVVMLISVLIPSISTIILLLWLVFRAHGLPIKQRLAWIVTVLLVNGFYWITQPMVLRLWEWLE